MPNNSVELLSAIGSVLSGIGTILSVLIAIAAFIYSNNQSKANLRYTEVQDRIKKYEIARDHRNSITNWFSKTVEILIELRLLLIHSPDQYKIRKLELLLRLSSQIEVGRMYFPNFDIHDSHGITKPTAYRGYRSIILDFLMYSYRICMNENAIEFQRHLLRLQREFTSSIYEVIEPQEFLNTTKQYSGIDFTRANSYEKFIRMNPDDADLFSIKKPQ
jgi:hypothetical protein